MYTAFPISLRAGQVGVLTFSAGANTTLGAIEGALYVADPEAPDAPLPPPTPCVVQDNVLYIPALPVGLHLFEVRVGGRTAVYQHVEVLLSPLGDMPGSAAWDVLVEAVGGEWHFTISAPAGPAGAPGAPGKSAYEVWLEAGHFGSEDDFLDSLQGAAGQDGKSPSAEDVAAQLIPRISAELACEGPAASNNWHASYFQLGENYLPQGTALSELGYRVRFDSLSGCTTDPVYLGVWELAENGVDWELMGVSTNTQVQALSSDVLWRFDPAQVRLSGRPIRCCLLATREDGWRTDLTMGMRVSSATGANTAIYYNDQSWASVPKYFLRGFKPAENITMSGGAEVEVDLQYDATSPRPQSGTAVAEALAALPTCSCGDEVYSTAELSKDWRDTYIGGFVLDPEVLGGKWLSAITWQPTRDLTTPYRLQVLEVGVSGSRKGQMSLSDNDVQDVALSVNEETLSAEAPVRYEFDPPIHISKGKATFLRLQTDGGIFSNVLIYIETSNGLLTDSAVLQKMGNSQLAVALVPRVELSFVGESSRQVAKHAADMTVHLSEEEHEKLTQLLENGGSGGSGTGSGGESGAVDNAYSPTSSNAASGKAVAEAINQHENNRAHARIESGLDCLTLGSGTTFSGYQAAAVGQYCSGNGHAAVAFGAFCGVNGDNCVAVGSQCHGFGGRRSVAMGYYVDVSGESTAAYGIGTSTADDGVLVLGAKANEGASYAQLYLLPPGSPLSKKYTDGEAALGYVVWEERDLERHIISSGTRKLADILTDNKNTFTPDINPVY